MVCKKTNGKENTDRLTIYVPLFLSLSLSLKNCTTICSSAARRLYVWAVVLRLPGAVKSTEMLIRELSIDQVYMDGGTTLGSRINDLNR